MSGAIRWRGRRCEKIVKEKTVEKRKREGGIDSIICCWRWQQSDLFLSIIQKFIDEKRESEEENVWRRREEERWRWKYLRFVENMISTNCPHTPYPLCVAHPKRGQGRGDGREEVGYRGEGTKAKAKREVKWVSKLEKITNNGKCCFGWFSRMRQWSQKLKAKGWGE